MKEIKLLESPLYGISAAGGYSELLHERDGIRSKYLIKMSIRQWSAEFHHKMYYPPIHRSHLVCRSGYWV